MLMMAASTLILNQALSSDLNLGQKIPP